MPSNNSNPGRGSGSGGGRPGGGETIGNNLSFPAIFPGIAPPLRGNPNTFLFTTPTYLSTNPQVVYFAQGVAGNEWQAGSVANAGLVTVEYVDIGDALETAPIKQGSNIRLEMTLYEELSSPLTGFAMTLLGGAKGKGKPSTVGPTESQGAQLSASVWNNAPYTGTTASAPSGTTYSSNFASVYAASSTGGETTTSYMRLAIQSVTGLQPGDDITGLSWNGLQWVDPNPNDDITVGSNLASNVKFGPELNIAGKYIMGASGSPWKFTSDGTYLVTFALNPDALVRLEEGTTKVMNDDPAVLGFQPTDPGAVRRTQVITDGLMSTTGDTHNGLLAMLVGVPSTVSGGE